MSFDASLWTRLTFDDVPIYVRPDKPDWFVPNRAGDQILRDLASPGPAPTSPAAQRFLARLDDYMAEKRQKKRSSKRKRWRWR